MATEINIASALVSPRRQLAQSRPAGTAAVTAWLVPYFGQYTVNLINIVNVSTTLSVDISIFHDPTGIVYDEDTALVYKWTLGPGDIFQYGGEDEIEGYQFGGSIGVMASAANIANFKIYGSLAGETVGP